MKERGSWKFARENRMKGGVGGVGGTDCGWAGVLASGGNLV